MVCMKLETELIYRMFNIIFIKILYVDFITRMEKTSRLTTEVVSIVETVKTKAKNL